MAVTVQQGVSTSGLSTTKRNVMQVRAGNVYAESYALKQDWKQLVETWNIKQGTVEYIANLNSLLAARWSGEYNFAGSLVGKQTFDMYPFEASARVKEELIQDNLIPALASLAEDVGDAMGQLMRRYVFNSYSGGDAIQCLDANATAQFLYDTTHADGSQNNALTATFSEPNLEAAINAMGAFMDHTGKKQIGGDPNVILLNPSHKTAATKLLMGPMVIMEGLKSTSAATTRIPQNLFSGITPMFCSEIHVDEFILVDTTKRKKPFIFNIPDGGDGTEVSKLIIIGKDEQKTDDYLVTCKMRVGMCATEKWFDTITSGTSHNTPWAVDETASDL